jgi:hypothetical protein
MTVFTEDCDRDLKRKKAAALEACLFTMARQVGSGKKRKEAIAEKKRKEAVTSESGDGAIKKKGDSLFKEGEMLKLREEYWEAAHLWEEKLVLGVLDCGLERKIT